MSQDVLIVGAGPTGLTLAAALVRAGIVPRLIDQAAVPPADRSRAMVIQPRTLELFDDLGVVDEVLAAGLHVPALDVFAHTGGHARLSFLAHAPVDSPYGGIFSLPQDQTERILTDLVTRQGVTIERGVALTALATPPEEDARPSATLRHPDGRIEVARPAWVFGADGAHSTVRHAVGLPFDGITYPDECLLGDVCVDWGLPHDSISLCPTGDGILLVFPLPGDRHFRLIMILPRNEVADDRRLERAEFEHQLRAMVPRGAAGREPRLLDVSWLTRYRLHRRGVPAYRRGRAFVGGDAAHIHSPAGGQGMNTGIQDAYNLGWKLALVARGVAPASLLDTYDGERQPVGERLLRGTDRLFGLMAGRGPVRRLLRAAAPTLVGRVFDLPAVATAFTRFVSELGIRYRASPLSVEGPGAHTLGHGAPRAGDRAPDAPLADDHGAPGGPRRVFDLLRGPQHTLLLFAGTAAGGAPDVPLSALAAEVAARYGDLVRPCVLDGATDRDGAAHARYGAERGALYLIRPDGYVAFRGAARARDAVGGDQGEGGAEGDPYAALRADLARRIRPPAGADQRAD